MDSEESSSLLQAVELIDVIARGSDDEKYRALAAIQSAQPMSTVVALAAVGDHLAEAVSQARPGEPVGPSVVLREAAEQIARGNGFEHAPVARGAAMHSMRLAIELLMLTVAEDVDDLADRAADLSRGELVGLVVALTNITTSLAKDEVRRAGGADVAGGSSAAPDGQARAQAVIQDLADRLTALEIDRLSE